MPKSGPNLTLEQIAKEPFKHIDHKSSTKLFYPHGFQFILGCSCCPEFLPTRGSIRSELMTAVTEYLSKQVEHHLVPNLTMVGVGGCFDALQLIATAQQAGITELNLDLFEPGWFIPKCSCNCDLKALQELITYLATQNVRVELSYPNPQEHITHGFYLSEVIVDNPILSVKLNILNSTNNEQNIHAITKTNEPKCIIAHDLAEYNINPFIHLKTLKNAVSTGSELLVANKAASNQAKGYQVFLWHQIKTENQHWLNAKYSKDNATIGSFWAGFYARAPEGKGPNEAQLAAQPYGPYYDRPRFPN